MARAPAAALVAVLLPLAGLPFAASAARAAPTEHIQNGTFDRRDGPVVGDGTTLSTSRRPALRRRPRRRRQPVGRGIGHNGVPLVDGAGYTLTVHRARPARP